MTLYNKNVSEKVRSLSKKLEAAKDEKEFFDAVTGFYKDYGVGMFGLNKAFRIDDVDKILEVLNQNNVRITFFMVGDWIDKYPEAVKKINEAGQEIRKS